MDHNAYNEGHQKQQYILPRNDMGCLPALPPRDSMLDDMQISDKSKNSADSIASRPFSI